jgi:hypothetical protein
MKTIIALWIAFQAGLFGFGDADIAAMKRAITEAFEEDEGVEVTEVYMIRDGVNVMKATGFVRLKVPLFGKRTIEISKSCSATMDWNRKYFWRCG